MCVYVCVCVVNVALTQFDFTDRFMKCNTLLVSFITIFNDRMLD